MASNATISPHQIARARKLLQNIPEKEDRKTRPGAAALLERDFKKTKEKGYNPKELSQLLKNEGIIIPVYLIRGCPAYTLLYQFSPKDTGQSKVK